MKKRKIIIIFILVIFILIFFSPVYAQDLMSIDDKGICEQDRICKLNCENGDHDCTCGFQNGFICSKGEECKAKMINSWEEVTCCSEKCIISNLRDNNEAKALTDVSEQKQEVIVSTKSKEAVVKASKDAKYSLAAFFLISFLLVIFINHLMHHFSRK